MRIVIPFIVLLTFIAGCSEDRADVKIPDPLELTAEAAGHYCQMMIFDHEGPKGQAHFTNGMPALWFSQVRDGLAYILSPEEEYEVAVLYMNDMAHAKSWKEPGTGNWITAKNAYFVVGSDAIGGMGAPEIVPFGTMEAAMKFVTDHGGDVMRLSEIPIEAVLAPINLKSTSLEQQK